MERGSIKFIMNHNQQLRIEAQLVNNTLWLTKHEIADFFNIYVNAVTSNLHIIFKNRLLEEQEVTRTYTYQDKNVTKEQILYNLEVLIHLSYRVSSREAKAFREWSIQAMCQSLRQEYKKDEAIIVVCNYTSSNPILSIN